MTPQAVPVRLFLTPDSHYGYGVPVGCVLVTDARNGAIAMGPVGYDIGCGMMSASSKVPAEEATREKKLQFNRAVMKRVDLGAGGKSKRFGNVSRCEFEELIRGGAEYYVAKHGARFDRSRAERHRIPVDDSWTVPYGGRGRPERGLDQLGSLGGGNHFIELQRSEESGTLFVQVHTGSRGFGHGLATNYFDFARDEYEVTTLDLGYFTPESRNYRAYLNAVAAGGNYAILNCLVLFEQVSEAFREVFGQELDLAYEISHNLVQKEMHPGMGEVYVHRKGATRAFPAGHPALLQIRDRSDRGGRVGGPRAHRAQALAAGVDQGRVGAVCEDFISAEFKLSPALKQAKSSACLPRRKHVSSPSSISRSDDMAAPAQARADQRPPALNPTRLASSSPRASHCM